jgi:elongation factor P
MADRANDLKRGRVINHNGDLYTVTDVTRVSKGNWRSYLQVKLKNIKDGRIIDERLSPDDKVEIQFVDTKNYQYLYRDGDNFVLMDEQTYDQIPVESDLMGDADKFLRGNEQVQVSFIDGKIVGVELPNTVELDVADAPPVVKGATATNQSKEATMETGLRVKVPPFIEIGESLKIDTRTGEYIARAKD